MRVHHEGHIPASDKNTLLLVALAEEGLESVAAQLAELLGERPDLTPDLYKKSEAKMTVHCGFPLLIQGMGAAITTEGIRRAMAAGVKMCQSGGFQRLVVLGSAAEWQARDFQAAAEGLLLSNYRFLIHKNAPKASPLTEAVIIAGGEGAAAGIARGQTIAEATMQARDLVNEPANILTAPELGRRAEALGAQYGFGVEVLGKAKISALKMGGLLAVNAGSDDPPSFSILTYKPKNPVNPKPVLLVGKGVVYDTGGLSLKPTLNSMDFMKSDMAGAAAVIGTFCAIAALGLDVHVVGLIPATDNRLSDRAYSPGDVVRMFDGSSVEVMNTDAEGRMILADALAYAKKFDPALTIDLATLTGAAVVAVGHLGIAMMSTADREMRDRLVAAGEEVHERIVEFPLWEEYREELKSNIADLKNLGGRWGGCITAGKFLQHFTDYPWVHLDIAGPAWLGTADHYRSKDATGVGVRLLTHFLTTFASDD